MLKLPKIARPCPFHFLTVPLTMLLPTFVLLQATFEGWMELMDDAVDSKEVIVDLK